MHKISYILLLTIILITNGNLFGQTSAKDSVTIMGIVLDEKKEPIIGGIVRVTQNGKQKGAAQTDFDGRYMIKVSDTGKYNVIVDYIGYKQSIITNISLKYKDATIVNVSMEVNNDIIWDEIIRIYCPSPIYDKYNPGSQRPISSEELEKMPTR